MQTITEHAYQPFKLGFQNLTGLRHSIMYCILTGTGLYLRNITLHIQNIEYTFWLFFAVWRSWSRWSRKYFVTWSRSQNYPYNKYFLQSVWRMLGRRNANFYLYQYGPTFILQSSCGKILMQQELEPEPEPKIWTKVEPEPKINNFGSAILIFVCGNFRCVDYSALRIRSVMISAS